MARKSLAELLALQARYNPHGTAVTYGDTKLSWGALNARVNRLANALVSLGVKKGDHAIIMLHDCPAFLEINYALQKLGAVPVPMNFRFVAREIEYQTNHCDAILFFYDSRFAPEVGKARPHCPKVKTFICIDRDKTDAPADTLDYEQLFSRSPATEPVAPPTTEDDVCTICYTGGTTGLPKGVMLTYGNFRHLTDAMNGDLLGRMAGDPKVNFGRVLARLLPIPGLERIVNAVLGNARVRAKVSAMIPRLLPKIYDTPIPILFNRFTGGFTMFLNMPLFHMANYQTLIVGPMAGFINYILRPSIPFDPKLVLEIIARERPMLALLVPAQWKMVLDYPDLNAYDTHSLLVAMTGAGAMPCERKKQILAAFPNAVVADVFGQTEMTPDTTLRIDADMDGIKDRAVGKPLSGLEVRIVREDGTPVAKGEVGEILYRSPTIMKGYYGEEDKTKSVIRDGWFHSGDLGYIDGDGEVVVADRKTETINTGAEKVFPLEVEEILETHENVMQVCVIGVPDEKWGHAVRAVIVLRDGLKIAPEELIDWCRDKMTGFKIPKSVVFADSLPVNPVGKVMRKQIKELYGGV